MAGQRNRRAAWVLALLVGLSATWSQDAAFAEDVDLELLLAVDVSPSVDAKEYALQIRGLAEALRHPDVIGAIEAVGSKGIAVGLMQWAGPGEQVLSVPWAAVRDRTGAEALAKRIEAVARPPSESGTALGDALAEAIASLNRNEFRGARRVIDISGDGRTNLGGPPEPQRARAVELGITVNGLVILTDERFLSVYYRYRVIAGPGAFVLQVGSYEDFASAIRMKLVREIRMSMLPGQLAIPALR